MQLILLINYFEIRIQRFQDYFRWGNCPVYIPYFIRV